MKYYALSMILIILIVVAVAVLTSRMTGGVVATSEPCRLVHCNTDVFGIYQNSAEQVGITARGEAVCHCPLEPAGVLHYIPIGNSY